MSKATRASFGEALVELGKEHPEVVVLDADLSKSTKSEDFGKKYPERFFQMGIQEANMIGVAAGLSFCGKTPFLCSFGAFLSGRFDIIRVTAGYANANIRLVGTHAGVGIGEDGCSQMALEDLACMRTLPGMAVLQPCDDVETKAMMRFLVKDYKGPAYLRLTRQNVPTFLKSDFKFELGKFQTLKTGTTAAIFATGGLVGPAMQAATELEKSGLSVAVINASSIKPVDRSSIVDWGRKVKFLFTAEDHNMMGGLGGAVSEVMAEEGVGARLTRIAVRDIYGESGTPEALYHRHGFDPEGIIHTVRTTLG